MIMAFFDVIDTANVEFLLHCQTINQHVYKEIPQRLLHLVKDKDQICTQLIVLDISGASGNRDKE